MTVRRRGSLHGKAVTEKVHVKLLLNLKRFRPSCTQNLRHAVSKGLVQDGPVEPLRAPRPRSKKGCCAEDKGAQNRLSKRRESNLQVRFRWMPVTMR